MDFIIILSLHKTIQADDIVRDHKYSVAALLPADAGAGNPRSPDPAAAIHMDNTIQEQRMLLKFCKKVLYINM